CAPPTAPPPFVFAATGCAGSMANCFSAPGKIPRRGRLTVMRSLSSKSRPTSRGCSFWIPTA
ncbi:hypothetical protein, partial [Pseudomonas fluorescens]